MATRVGVDVGGTFTDLIFYDDATGEVRVGKEPTTPAAPEAGVLAAVRAAMRVEAMGSTDYFLHGTTVGLNSLLTRTGATVGLLATRGFRDVIEIRRGDRDEMFNLFWTMPPPLVPRRLRLPVTGRIRHDGSVLVPLEQEDVRTALEVFRVERVDCVAVAFLNSYANPAHELEAESALRSLGFEGEISLSHRVSGEYREYERTCTTLIDAYVRPRMTSYLRTLEQALRREGFSGSCLVTRSGGGAMTFAEAEARPFETILSGPVAGAEGAAELARNLELGDVISADVGGTSFDTCLITRGRPQVLYEGKVVSLPLQTTWVDVQSIGAGGGSIASVDVGGFLKVGPQSAGADPGPASYGRDGTEPTVTDAALALGMLAAGELAGGLHLDLDRARSALAPLGKRLGFDVEDVARGVLRIVTANMAHAIREITIERGHDPRRAGLMVFGGAGPLFGCLLARDLEIRELIVPPYAGNFSAWGLLGADLTQTAARTRITRLSHEGIGEANRVLADLFAELETRVARQSANGRRAREVDLDMRYVGQEHSLTVRAPSAHGRITARDTELHEAFSHEYERTYRHTMEEPVEIVNLRATVRTPLPRRTEDYGTMTYDRSGEPSRRLEAYSFTRGAWLEFDVLRREELTPGSVIERPAIILEETATTYLDADFVARVHGSGCLLISDTVDGKGG
jgi:N-methylhydantoinase A